MKNLIYIIVFTLLGMACKNNEHGHDHDGHSGHEAHASHTTNEVALNEKQALAIGLKLGTLSSIQISEEVQTNGELELAPQNIADVHVLIGGIINNIRVIEGTKVSKGDILASIKHPDIIKIQEDLIHQQAQLNYAENEYKRQEKLYQEEVGSGKAYQKIKAEYEGLKALTDALKAKLKMLGINPEKVIQGQISAVIYVRSPLNGKVSLVETNMGEFVSTSKRLFQIVDNSHIHAAFRIYEKDILKIKEGQKIEVSSPSFEDKKFQATIYAISPAFEENPKNVHVHADFDQHDDRLISGMYISGNIKIDSITRNVLPRTAIVSEDGVKYVFIKEVQKEEGHKHAEGEVHDHAGHDNRISGFHFIKHEVLTGLEKDNWVEILSELPKGVEIALTGAYDLQAEIGKEEVDHVH